MRADKVAWWSCGRCGTSWVSRKNCISAGPPGGCTSPPPTLSQQIKQLEREVGTTLLIRHSRGVELTPAGQVFLARARETIQAAGLALKDTRPAAGLDEPVLRDTG